MNAEQITELARQAGMEIHPRKMQIRVGADAALGLDSTDVVMRFATLVRNATLEEAAGCGRVLRERASGNTQENQMTKQIDELMKLAFAYRMADTVDLWPTERDLRTALEAALKPGHVLYTTADKDRPDAICDRNGEVVLSQCKVCGKAESELDQPCAAPPAQTPPNKAELLCVCGAEWEWENRSWELVSTPAQTPALLHQSLTDPENQPNQFGVSFGMRGEKMFFKVGTQQFTLAYEPDEPGDFEFMRDSLIHAFSTFTPDVKMTPPPRLTDTAIQTMWNWALEFDTLRVHSGDTSELTSPASSYKQGVKDGETAVRRQLLGKDE